MHCPRCSRLVALPGLDRALCKLCSRRVPETLCAVGTTLNMSHTDDFVVTLYHYCENLKEELKNLRARMDALEQRMPYATPPPRALAPVEADELWDQQDP